MDTFGAARGHVGATTWLTVNWDTWRLRSRGPSELGRTIAELEMSPQEAIDILERIVAYMPPQVIVSTGNSEARFHQWVRISESEGEAMGRLSSSPGTSNGVCLAAKRSGGQTVRHVATGIWARACRYP